MKKINILYCIEYLSSGGTEKQLISLINSLDRNKFQPHLCCLRYSIIGKHRRKEALDFFEKMECSKIQLDFISFYNIQALIEIFKLIKFIKKHRIDIVQTYFQDPAFLGLLAAKLSGVKNVIACFRDMGFWREDESHLKIKMVYKSCSAYIANSLAVKEVYKNVYDLDDSKFEIIYNGIDLENFSPKLEMSKSQFQSLKVVIVANFNREVKRVDIFLRAAAYVLKRHEGIKFLVAGDGELKEDLIKLSGELGISKSVEFLGRVENIPQLLSTINIGVISSDSEGFSNAILEYMAAGVPVVATDVGGNCEIIDNSVNGFLVPRGDYCSMGEKILQLATEKETYRKIQESASEKIYRDYTLRHYIENYEKYYENLLFQKA